MSLFLVLFGIIPFLHFGAVPYYFLAFFVSLLFYVKFYYFC